MQLKMDDPCFNTLFQIISEDDLASDGLEGKHDIEARREAHIGSRPPVRHGSSRSASSSGFTDGQCSSNRSLESIWLLLSSLPSLQGPGPGPGHLVAWYLVCLFPQQQLLLASLASLI